MNKKKALAAARAAAPPAPANPAKPTKPKKAEAKGGDAAGSEGKREMKWEGVKILEALSATGMAGAVGCSLVGPFPHRFWWWGRV